MFPNIPEDLNATPPNLDRTEKEYHVFIANSSDAEDISKELKDSLESLKFSVYTDDDFEPGWLIIHSITEAVKKSQKIIFLVAKEVSNWTVFNFASSKAKCIAENEDLLIPIICDVDESQMPLFVKESNYLKANDRDFWQHLIRKLTAKIPLSESLPVGNIGHGIAWSYFYGFLNVVLPDMAKKMEDFEPESIPYKKCYKFIIIIPDSCKIPNDFNDKSIQKCGKLQYKKFRAGKPRQYNVTLYKIEDPDTRERYIVPMQYASAVSVLHKMEVGRASLVDRQERMKQVRLFKEKIEEIVNYALMLTYKPAVFIQYQDDCDEPEDSLVKVVMRHLKDDHTICERPNIN